MPDLCGSSQVVPVTLQWSTIGLQFKAVLRGSLTGSCLQAWQSLIYNQKRYIIKVTINTRSSYVTCSCSPLPYRPLPIGVMYLCLPKKSKDTPPPHPPRSQVSFKYITLLAWIRSNTDKKILQTHKPKIIWGFAQWRLRLHGCCPWRLFRALKSWHSLRIFSHDSWTHSDSDLPPHLRPLLSSNSRNPDPNDSLMAIWKIASSDEARWIPLSMRSVSTPGEHPWSLIVVSFS